MEEHRLSRHIPLQYAKLASVLFGCLVLLHCVKPTPESIFGDLIDTDVDKAISLAKDRVEWKRNRPSKLC